MKKGKIDPINSQNNQKGIDSQKENVNSNDAEDKANLKRILKYYNYFKHYFLKYFLISLGSLVILILIILWAAGTITISGDGYCTAKECSSGSPDCSPDECIDTICQPQVGETCKNNDCQKWTC